jgi:poly(A) polymerase
MKKAGTMQVISKVLSFIADQNIDAYFVGGLVRDELLGRSVKRDIDLAVDGDAIELARAFADAHGGAFYLMDEEHNVARVMLGETYVDFAQLRGGVRADLASRDFTINAIARRLGSNELADPFHGERDLHDRKVRAVSDDIFKNDPVRLLRAVRIAGELAFSLDEHTVELIRRDSNLLAFASTERARDELCKILALSNPSKWLRLADSLGLVDILIPELSAIKTAVQSAPHVFKVFDHTMRVLDEVESIQSRGYAEILTGKANSEIQSHFSSQVSGDHNRSMILRMATLLHDIGKPVTFLVEASGAVQFYAHDVRGAEMSGAALHRLRFSNDEVELVSRIVLNHLRPSLLADEPRLTNRSIYRFFRDTGDAGIDVCVLALADRRGTYAAETNDKHESNLRATITRLVDAYFGSPQTIISPPSLIDGRDLMKELGLTPGRDIGELLEGIREAQADEQVKTREQAIAYARSSLAARAAN